METYDRDLSPGRFRRANADPERALRLHVHVAIASIVLAFLAPVVTWGLVLADRRAPAGTWKRRLLALACFDTVLILAVALAGAQGLDASASTHAPQRIGVVLDGRDPPGGVAVTDVAPAGPAAAAALQSGDRIVAVDTVPIEHNRELRAAIARTPASTSRRLTVVRDGARLELVVLPSRDAPAREPPLTSLFESRDTEDGLARSTDRRLAVSAGLFELALVGALAVAARRRGAPAAPALAVLAGLVALTLVSSVVLLVFRMTLGVSLGALLVALLSGSGALLVVGLLAAKLTVAAPVQLGPKLSAHKAITLGTLYGMAGSVRIAMLLALLVAAFGLPVSTAADAFGLDRSWGPLGVGIFVVAAVIVAPLAEEVVFRGVFLPWLARWMRPVAALAWSTTVFAAGHLHYGAGVLVIAYYGLVLGWARLRTGNLWAPIALHALLNATTAAALLLADES